MLHAYDNTLYNRTVTYPLLGFNDLYFSDEIQQMGIERADGAYGGFYMRDGYFFQGMLERMKAVNESGKRAFLFGITMENHQPFEPQKFNYECQIPLVAPDFTPAQRDIIRVMLEGITRADQALGELAAMRYVDYLDILDAPAEGAAMTLDQLAGMVHMSKYYLSHSFRKEFQTSPISYLISRRIQESRFLLRETDLRLSQIAQILGFSSLSYFSQSFRRLEDMSPLEYRKQQRGRPTE